MKSVIYHAFSQKEAKELDVQLPGAQQAEAFVRAFLKRSTPHMSQQAREDQLQRKAVVLEYATRRKRKEKRKKSKGLSARQRRELHLFDIKPEQQRYSLFLPLHELWKQYIRDLCGGLKPDTQPHVIQTKLLKADLHGALVSDPIAETWAHPSNLWILVVLDTHVTSWLQSPSQDPCGCRPPKGHLVRTAQTLQSHSHKVQMPVLCGCYRNSSTGNKARFQNPHQRRPPESYPQAKLCVRSGNRWLHLLHLWKQIPASVK
ncbi:ribonuclease P protein subunit p29 isoform X1 [Mustela erminea]|uniref:ribonuclease P protein subunit p29 isoform X1 n=1 Tax=Mustela erminea TaxID=36723 RepID=UPI001386BE70|nr:ribonuclease P protein subunit p29 isoform X1 [Mustela erminea]